LLTLQRIMNLDNEFISKEDFDHACEEARKDSIFGPLSFFRQYSEYLQKIQESWDNEFDYLSNDPDGSIKKYFEGCFPKK
jgi:hypothetical protein